MVNHKEHHQYIKMSSSHYAQFDDLTGTEVRIGDQQIICFYCWEKGFYESNAKILRPTDGSKPFLYGPEGVGKFTIKIIEADPEVNKGVVKGKLKPKSRKKLDKDLEE